ncbi:MAG TPA: hypothetical protein VN832_05695, partial [Stellaceae bacterium]|nr:hypothetical protein [Stellaceae bacterium]
MNFAICTSLYDCGDHRSDDALGGGSLELEIAPQEFPRVNIGRHDESMEQPGPGASGAALQLRSKDHLDPAAMLLTPDFHMTSQCRTAKLFGEIPDHLVADRLVIVIEGAHRRGDVAGRRILALSFGRRLHEENRERFLAAENAEHRLHRGAGAERYLVEGEVFEQALGMERDRGLADARLRRLRLGRPKFHRIGALSSIHVRLTNKYEVPVNRGDRAAPLT